MELQQLGIGIGRGIVKQLGDYALIYLTLALVFGLAYRYFGLWLDDSDKSGSERSGLSIHTDYRTGLQYLSDGKGGMVLRVDADGKPILVKPK